MVLVTLIFLASFSSLLVSLTCLVLVIRFIYQSKDYYKSTTSSDAILISGCDSGIGLELAKYFFNNYNFKVICGFLSPSESAGYEELSKLSSQRKDDRLILKKLDVTSEEDLIELVGYLDQSIENGTFKNLIGLINNAGILMYGEFDWLTWDQIHKQIDVNFLGTVKLTRAVLPYIRDSRGRIINVSSVNDTTVFPGLSIYSATKSAISTFSKGLGYELKKFGVSVVTMRLGDFARLTNIMSKHTSNKDEMWNDMSPKKKILYKDFFQQFNRHLLDNYGMTSPKNFETSSLFEDFKKALLAKNPPKTIVCAPLGFKIFYFVLELIPIWLQYYILDLLFRFGFGWEPPKVKEE